MSVVGKLKQPEPSKQARERKQKVQANPKGGARKSVKAAKHRGGSKTITVDDRLETPFTQYWYVGVPGTDDRKREERQVDLCIGEGWINSAGCLFCTHCGNDVVNAVGQINQHLNSATHARKKKETANKSARIAVSTDSIRESEEKRKRKAVDKLPAFRLALRKVCAVSPSSAAAERVFSVLRNSFGKQQKNTLEDMNRVSLMLQINGREIC